MDKLNIYLRNQILCKDVTMTHMNIITIDTKILETTICVLNLSVIARI